MLVNSAPISFLSSIRKRRTIPNFILNSDWRWYKQCTMRNMGLATCLTPLPKGFNYDGEFDLIFSAGKDNETLEVRGA